LKGTIRIFIGGYGPAPSHAFSPLRLCGLLRRGTLSTGIPPVLNGHPILIRGLLRLHALPILLRLTILLRCLYGLG